jgi:GT2 family glycosyltransferase
MTSNAAVSVIIPNWNGRSLLEKNLPALLAICDSYAASSEVIVVDDGSTDDSVEWLCQNVPIARLVERKRNSGFSSSVNEGIRAARHDLVLLLNNDIELENDFLTPLARRFNEEADLFAAMSVQRLPQHGGRGRLEGAGLITFHQGTFVLRDITETLGEPAKAGILVANGGCTLFSRRKLVALGGFCTLFDPFYCEDTELSMRAQKQGWRIEVCPDSIVTHRPGTSTRNKPFKFYLIPMRNWLLLHWLTIDSAALWRAHACHVLRTLARRVLAGQPKFLLGLCLALPLLPAVYRERKRRSFGTARSLEEILKSSNPINAYGRCGP